MDKIITLNLEMENGEIIQVGKERINPSIINDCNTIMFTENDSDNFGIVKIGEIQVEYSDFLYLYLVNNYDNGDTFYCIFSSPKLYNENGYFETINIEYEKIVVDSDLNAMKVFMEKVLTRMDY